MTNYRRMPILLVLIVAASCSTDDFPTSGQGDSRVIESQPSFSADIQEIFNRRGCSATPCHGTSQSAGLDLRAGNSYGSLVGVSSTQSGMPRVDSANVSNSYLVVKLEGPGTTGGQMPLGQMPLDSIDLQNIKNWIAQGALNN